MKLISSRGRGYPWFYLEVNVIKDVEWNVDSLQHAKLGWIPRKSEVHTVCFLKISGISEKVFPLVILVMTELKCLVLHLKKLFDSLYFKSFTD